MRIAIVSLVVLLSAARFFFLDADFPNESPWLIDQAKFTDEGWWASGAVNHFVTGHWCVAGDYNPAVALPVWPTMLAILFHLTGVGVVAARALNVSISIATLAALFLLVRRFTHSEAAALTAALLMAASPFAFAFSRLAILDTVVVFEFCLLLLIASHPVVRRASGLAILPLLVAATLLTKTTAALLMPAVLWLAWCALRHKRARLLRALIAVAIVPAILVKAYALLVAKLGYGADYRYFFDVNAMPDIDWHQILPTLRDLLQNCLWVDRILYPVALLILLVTIAWARNLWRNPLFTASWIALASQAAFIFSRQDDYAPRYFLVMLPPTVMIVALTFAEAMRRAPITALLLAGAIAASVFANIAMVTHFLAHRDYDLSNAAAGIKQVVQGHPEQKPLLLGVSASQISLMTGIASINDFYGSEDMGEKLKTYRPGWYLVWNSIAPENQEFLASYKLEKMASYPAFDDDDRNLLILYKMTAISAGK